MKILKLLLAGFVLACVGAFVFAAITPVNIEQAPMSKTIDAEPFLNNES